MAVPIYIVRGPQAGAKPIWLTSNRDATEVVVVDGRAPGASPAYIAGPREVGVTPVRVVGGSRDMSGTL